MSLPARDQLESIATTLTPAAVAAIRRSLPPEVLAVIDRLDAVGADPCFYLCLGAVWLHAAKASPDDAALVVRYLVEHGSPQ